MKNIYIFLSIALISFTASGQQKMKLMTFDNAKLNKLEAAKKKSTTASNMAPGDTIAYEDFASIPSGWTQGGTDQMWKHTYQGSTGQYSSSGLYVNSTTVNNGFLIYDVDSAQTINDPTGYTKVYDGSLITAAYDFSTYAGVNVQFEQFFRLCCSTANSFITFSVSNDGGSTWTDFDVTTAGINDNPINNPDMITLNVTSVAAGQSNVMFKWSFSGRAYYWMIDDFLLYESPQNELALNEAMIDMGYFNGGFYTQTPLNQVVNDTFRGVIQNMGNAAQTNVTLNVSVTAGSTVVFTEATSTTVSGGTLSSMATNVVDTLITTTAFVPDNTWPTSYRATFFVDATEADEDFSNDTIIRDFATSDTVYARDNGVPTARTSTGQYIGGDVDGSFFGNQFDIVNNDVAKSISAYISSASTIGTYIYATLYHYNTATDDFDEVASSNVYDLDDSSKTGTWVHLPLTTGNTTLTANEIYIAGIKAYGLNATSDVYIGEDMLTAQPEATTFIYLPTPTDAWYYVDRLPMIRLNTQAIRDVGVKNQSNNLFSVSNVYPNPFSKSADVTVILDKAAQVSLEISNTIGQKVMTTEAEVKAAGTHTLTIDGSKLNAGVYFYTVKAGDYSITKKMIIK